jgi:hypothetical protein
VGGLASSGLMTPALAWALLIAYYLLSIDLYLAAHALGTFKLSFGRVGGTELRLLLGLLNGIVWLAPRVSLPAGDLLVFDAAGALATAALVGTVLVSGIGVSRRLAREEALP